MTVKHRSLLFAGCKDAPHNEAGEGYIAQHSHPILPISLNRCRKVIHDESSH